MSIQTTCPGCQAPFTLAATMAGKKIRCGQCQEVFTVKATNRKRRGEEDDDVEEAVAVEDDDEPRARIRNTPPAASRGPASIRQKDEYDDLPRPPIAQPRNNTPLLVGGAIACVAMLVGGGITIALLMRGGGDSKPDTTKQASTETTKPAPVVSNPPTIGTPPPTITPTPIIQPPPPVVETKAPETTTTAAKAPPRTDATRRGELTREAKDEVKRATVLIRVTLHDGSGASGTGFFGAPDSPNIILTNAHVVGMLSANSRKPKKVEVVLNSGQSDERPISANILGVDRISDLAVLDVGTAPNLPKPLNVKSGEDLHELEKVFIFGFPFGEQVGKEISASESSVSSKRFKGPVLERIQVNGGMNPGNSGGPVVDDTGHVVGVAVAGIPGTNINFAIPGSRVETILNGRVMEMVQGQPFKAGDQVSVPVALAMIDPRKRVKEVFVDVWTGNAPPANAAVRGPVNTNVEGDSKRERIPLDYVGGVARAEVKLPAMPLGKVWWVQGGWTTTNGKTYWDSATVYKPSSQPVERRSVFLKANYISRTARRLDVNTTTRFKVGAEADTEVAKIEHKASLQEQGANNGAGTTLRLTYRNAEQQLTVNKRNVTLPHLALAKPNLKKLTAFVDLDAGGNVSGNAVQGESELVSDESGRALLFLHQPTRFALYPLLIGMPNSTVTPMQTWKTTRQIAVDTIGPPRQGMIDLSCTYLGVRAVGGRDEAVINIDGIIRDPAMAGRARGLAILDVASSTVKKVEMEMEVDMPPLEIEIEEGKKQKLRVISVVSMKLERNL